MNVFLTYASNINEKNWIQYQVYFHSVCKIIGNNKAVCLTDNLNYEYEKKIKELNFEVLYCPQKNKKIFTNRWYAYWNFFQNHHFDKVIITDSRDVLFQYDPFSFCPEYSIGVVSEGFDHKSSPFNMMDQLNLQKNQLDNLETYVDWDVLNGGIFLAYHKYFSDFCYLMWSNCLGRPSCTDQAVLNFLYNGLKKTGKIYVFDPRKDIFCLTGEAEKENLLPFNASFQNGFIQNENGQKFCLFHQWDRTKFSNEILKTFIK